MNKLIVLVVSLLSVSSVACESTIVAKCAQAASGIGFNYVCRNINNTPTQCNVSACHSDVLGDRKHRQVAEADTVCTESSRVSNDGLASSNGSIIAGNYFSLTAKAPINKSNMNACFYYDVKTLIRGWDPNEAHGTGHRVVQMNPGLIPLLISSLHLFRKKDMLVN